MLVRRMSLEELALAVGLPVPVLKYLADIGYIHPFPQLPAAEFDELRRIRRLIDDLEVPSDAIDLVLHAPAHASNATRNCPLARRVGIPARARSRHHVG